MYDVSKLLELAPKETKNLNEREVFLVKELFKGYEWNRLPRKDRLFLGTLFLNHINRNGGKIQSIEKTISVQQKYEKIS